MSHRYAVGQMLDLRSAPRHSNRPTGPCEVVACLPHEKGPVLYRVKSWGESNERVVEEVDLSPSSATKSVKSANERVFSIAIGKR
ncbi:hypothetical protein GCM10011321_04850 [Youhaiella tibetensis]|uniref:Uncharacterized protein n=1 Tax=Paradevosia tibetensis TaxID=1447062 RepID=A0A5B9DSJ8_9HYPH|nr:hypothetical protein [Youhaiella tibetensis]QEE21324.1 hypothetical protein FNA67_14515 [Youhaiella tibetensis]GGF15981.1 hypothetical protein GCM10011321_04850 [Youhaiella tibetensis]